jgi:putative membrane protein
MTTSIGYAFVVGIVAAASVAACGNSGGGTGDTQQAFTGVPSQDGGAGNDGGTGGSSGGTSSGGTSSGGTSSGGTSSGGTGDGGAACTPTPSLALCSDGQAAAVLHASSKAEIDLANAVVGRLSDANVKAFASRMVTEHTASDAALTSVLATAGITMAANGVSKAITDAGNAQIQGLAAKTGMDLDKAYIEQAVLDHVANLAISDHIVMPSIKNTALASYAEQDRALMATHAQGATTEQTSLEGSCGSNAGQ